MADLEKITNFEIFRWRAKTTEFVEAGAAIIKHDTALPAEIDGNFFVAMDDINGNPIEAYVPAGAATDTQLGTTLLPLQWQPATGTDITGDPANGGRIPAKKEMRTVVSKTLLLQTLKALKKEIGSSLKLDSPFEFLNEVGNQGISNLRTFVSEGARDIAFPDPFEESAYNGFLCLVAGVGYQYHNGTDWITLGASTSVISSWKSPPARVATTANVDIATELEAGDSIDNIVLAADDTVLVWMNTLAKENGLYVVPASGAATRRSDFDIGSEATGAAVAVVEGDTYADEIFICTSNNPTIGTDDVDFAKLNVAPFASLAEAQAGLNQTKNMNSYLTKASIEANQNISDADAAILTGGTGSVADSLHTHSGDSILVVRLLASDTLQESADTERVYGESATWLLKKEIEVNRKGKLRTRFDLKQSGDPGTASGRIYINGVAKGLQHDTTSTSYSTFTDITFDVEIGDLVQLYVRSLGSGVGATIRNFRAYFTVIYLHNTIVNVD